MTIARYTSPEPRSGCATTMIAGISASSITRLVVSRSCRRLIRSITNADRARIRSTFPSSEGWKRKNGSSIQRREPRAAAPSRNTSPIDASITPYSPSFSSRSRE